MRISSGSRGGRGGHGPPGPVKIGHKNDGHRRRPHRFHVSRPPPYPVAGSATENFYQNINTHCLDAVLQLLSLKCQHNQGLSLHS